MINEQTGHPEIGKWNLEVRVVSARLRKPPFVLLVGDNRNVIDISGPPGAMGFR
jgi:hypothetical protein